MFSAGTPECNQDKKRSVALDLFYTVMFMY